MDALFSSRRWLFWLLLGIAFLWFISAIQAILLPFIVGMGVAYFLDPAADWLERRGASRTMATVLITFLFFGLLTLGLIGLVPTLINQTEGLIRNLPGYIDTAREQVNALLQRYDYLLQSEQIDSAREAVSGSSKEIAGALGDVFQQLISSGMAIVNLISLIVLAPVVSFYLLRDWDRVVEQIDRLLPRRHADTIREQVRKIDDTLSGFVRGMVNVMLLLATFYAIGLSLVGLNFALLIALLGGVAIIIPYLGTFISGAAAVGMAYLQFDTLQPVLIVLAIFTAGQMLEGYVLTPKLVGDKINLHPLWLIFAMLAGGALFGFVGVLLAIPAAAVIGVLIRFAIDRYKHSGLYEEPHAS